MPYCPLQGFGAGKQAQWASIIWSSTPMAMGSCSSSASAYVAYWLSGTSWSQSWFCTEVVSDSGITYFGSVRCGFRADVRTPHCPNQGISASKQGYWPYIIWTSTPFTHDECTGSLAYRAYSLYGTSWAASWFCAVAYLSTHPTNPDFTHFGSVRCGFRVSVQTTPYCPHQNISSSKQSVNPGHM